MLDANSNLALLPVRCFPCGGLRRRTPGPPPFSSMNSRRPTPRRAEAFFRIRAPLFTGIIGRKDEFWVRSAEMEIISEYFPILSHRVSDPVFCLPSVLELCGSLSMRSIECANGKFATRQCSGSGPSPAISHARASTSADRVGSASMDKLSAWQNLTLRRQQQPWQRSTGPEAPSASAGLFHVTRSEPPKDRLLKSLNRKNAARCG
jgi:hypothetical protein